MQRTLRGNEQGAYRSGPPGRNGRNDWECRYTAAGPLQGTRSGNHRYIVTGAKDPIRSLRPRSEQGPRGIPF